MTLPYEELSSWRMNHKIPTADCVEPVQKYRRSLYFSFLISGVENNQERLLRLLLRELHSTSDLDRICLIMVDVMCEHKSIHSDT